MSATSVMEPIICDPEWPESVLAEIHNRHLLRTLVHPVANAAMERVRTGKSCWYDELVNLAIELHQCRELKDTLHDAVESYRAYWEDGFGNETSIHEAMSKCPRQTIEPQAE